jgi:hypothetical protein
VAAKPYTITWAIVETIRNHPKGQASLDEIYKEVNKLLGREVKTAVIRGCINRALVAEKGEGKAAYRPLFQRVAPRVYALSREGHT